MLVITRGYMTYIKLGFNMVEPSVEPLAVRIDFSASKTGEVAGQPPRGDDPNLPHKFSMCHAELLSRVFFALGPFVR